MMSPILQSALLAILRASLMWASGWLITHHVWSNAEAESYVNAAALFLISAGWEYRSLAWQHLKLMVSIMHPELTTVAAVAAKASEMKTVGTAPSVLTPANVAPASKGDSV